MYNKGNKYTHIFLYTVPSPPQNVLVLIVSSTAMLFSWEAPMHEGEGAIVGYLLEVRDSSERIVLVHATGAELFNMTLLPGLMESQEYV